MKNELRLPRWEELPSMPLYLDQVIGLMHEHLGDFIDPRRRKSMTKTMVNNYVKQKIIKPPQNKRYDKIAIMELIVIEMLKPAFSMEEIKYLIKLGFNADELSASYNYFCEVIEKSINKVFKGESFPGRENLTEVEYVLWCASVSLATKIYANRVYFEKARCPDMYKEELENNLQTITF